MKKKTWYWIIGIFSVLYIIAIFTPNENPPDISKPQLELGEATYPSDTESLSTEDSSQTENEFTSLSTKSKSSSTSSDNIEELNNQKEETPEPGEQTDSLKVTYIVDGDTLDISTGERVRLICIDTPERGEYYYSEASDYLESLALNKEVDLVKDKSETDRYGRLLRYIYLKDRTFVNELIVKNGYARAYPYGSDITLCPQIQEAEQYAKNNNLGIWEEETEDEPEEENGNDNIVCSSDYYNCGDFSTCSEVMEVFNACSSDIHGLDKDDDGIPCETLCG